MRKLWRNRTADVCARILCATLTLFLLFLALPRPARADSDGMIRVKLARLGAPETVRLEADCDYCLASDPSVRVPAGTPMAVSAEGGRLTLTAGETVAALGASATLARCVPGEYGARFTAPALSNRFCGDLTFAASGDVITTVLRIYIEDYLCGVVGCEMAPSSGLEALKAQAIAARNGALRQKALHSAEPYDVVDADGTLTFKGCSDAAEYAEAIRAVGETRGCVLYCGDSPALCYYSDSNGGQTESAANALGTALSYSAVRDDAFDLNSTAPKRTAVIRKDAEGLQPSLRGALLLGMADQLERLGLSAAERDIRIDAVQRVTACDPRYPAPSRLYKSLAFQLAVTGRAPDGQAKAATVFVSIPTYGSFESWYDLSLNDADNETVWVSDTGAAFEITFRRSGHGVGMSQRGAQVMAATGRSCEEILEYYYPGTTLRRLALTDATRDAQPVDDPEAASTEPVDTARLSARAELYEHADADATVLTLIPAGATVDVYAVQDGWAAVSSGGRSGFLRAEALVAESGGDAGEAVAAADDQYARVTEDAGLYVNADAAVKPRATLARDSYVRLLAYNRSWAYVRTASGEQGYVKRECLSAAQGVPAAADSAGTIDGGSVTLLKEIKTMAVQASALRLYRTYSTDSEVLATLAEGDEVQVGAFNSKWACVRFNGVTGFVLAGGLRETEPADGEAAVDGGAVKKVSGERYAVVAREGATLYATWRQDAEALAQLSPGDRVRVGAYNAKWACVRFDGVLGYMLIGDLEIADDGREDEGGVTYRECEAVAAGEVRLYADAALEGEPLATLPEGAALHVYAYNARVAYVEADGVRGFAELSGLRRLP